MSLLGKTSIKSLSQKSSKAIGVFTQTVSDLSKINDEASSIQEAKEQEIATLQTEVQEIETIKSENSRFINKINEFLNS